MAFMPQEMFTREELGRGVVFSCILKKQLH